MSDKIRIVKIDKDYVSPGFKPSTRDIYGRIPNCYLCKNGKNCKDHQIGDTGIPIKYGRGGLLSRKNRRKRLKKDK